MNTTNEQVAALVKKGYKIVSDGQTGVQLEKPKKMATLDVLCMVGGGVMLFLFAPVGLIMVAIAIIDYAFLTKAQTTFIPR